MGRTSRAYDLVVNYHRDCEGGQRWSRENIVHIHDLGKHLHSNIRALKRQRRSIAQSKLQDEAALRDVHENAETMREYCEQIQAVIRELESHLLPVDDQGNIFTDHGTYDKEGRFLGTSLLHSHEY